MKILDQHQNTARFVSLRKEKSPSIGRSRDVVVYWALNG
jgi:hypothetical protein